MGVESSKVEYLLSGPGKKVQLAITFRGENLNFYGQMTRVQVMMASLRCIQIGLPGSLLPESGRENSSPTVALYSQRLHIIFHTLSIPSQRTNAMVIAFSQFVKEHQKSESIFPRIKSFPHTFFKSSEISLGILQAHQFGPQHDKNA